MTARRITPATHLRGCAASAAGIASSRRRRSSVTKWPFTAKCAPWMQDRGRVQRAQRGRAACTHPRRRRQHALPLHHHGVCIRVIRAHVHRKILLRRDLQRGVHGATCGGAALLASASEPDGACCPVQMLAQKETNCCAADTQHAIMRPSVLNGSKKQVHASAASRGVRELCQMRRDGPAFRSPLRTCRGCQQQQHDSGGGGTHREGERVPACALPPRHRSLYGRYQTMIKATASARLPGAAPRLALHSGRASREARAARPPSSPHLCCAPRASPPWRPRRARLRARARRMR